MERVISLGFRIIIWFTLIFMYLWATGLFLMGLKSSQPNTAWLLTATGAIVVLCLIGGVGYILRDQLIKTIIDWKVVLRRGLMALVGLGLTSLVIMMTLRGYTTHNQDTLNSWLSLGGWRYWLMVVQPVLLAPITEELLFRGLFCQWFFQDHQVCQDLLSAALFATVHEMRLSLSWLLYFGTGLILVVLYNVSEI
ncbi:CPBP family intramembrane glutamic endopeptidase [Lactiplantibacillus plantarum]|uniref:CPBP family intramembrane glutamic endopeptidase n=1 Tax=Lactiplantibacillus plantarum TaxID=1590 RepID=UPI000977AD27|nr:CPBP family intramembrane glutamic endopeptidase [Lactiplantibacillus plantarum]